MGETQTYSYHIDKDVVPHPLFIPQIGYHDHITIERVGQSESIFSVLRGVSILV